MIAYGPVPSRRLGFSIGINNIPPKFCSYSCTYCQVGRTDHLIISPRPFLPVDEIVKSVDQKIRDAQRTGQKVDYLTFVPDGEPTLDVHLGEEIDAIKPFGFPIAVISNATLIDQLQTRCTLSKADWVSLKIDSVVEEIWRKVNRPHKRLNLEKLLTGMLAFADEFTGELVTETMLIAGVNDDPESVTRLADFLSELAPQKTYLSIPIRPPAENRVFPPDAYTLNKIHQIISKSLPNTECLFDAEENLFVATGDFTTDILSITSVHPIREEALKKMVKESGVEWREVEKLVEEKKLRRKVHRNEVFYQHDFSDT
ncbi:MAG: radical SAM protein [Anaerolineales bacterium]|nr:radical SAM protein [Anaerolineales bacterium]